MRKIVSSFLVFIIAFSLMRPDTARAEMPVKAKALLTIVGYGTAGGALLGAASMAFGTSTRAVAQGASLGLYAGIIFGAYVLVSHHNKRQGYYDDSDSPYTESTDIYGQEYNAEEGGGSEGDERDGGVAERVQNLQFKFGENKRGSQLPPLYLNLIQYNF